MTPTHYGDKYNLKRGANKVIEIVENIKNKRKMRRLKEIGSFLLDFISSTVLLGPPGKYVPPSLGNTYWFHNQISKKDRL